MSTTDVQDQQPGVLDREALYIKTHEIRKPLPGERFPVPDLRDPELTLDERLNKNPIRLTDLFPSQDASIKPEYKEQFAAETASYATQENDESAEQEEEEEFTALQKHVLFFDRNNDMKITPWETWQGCRSLGYGFFSTLIGVILVHIGFGWLCSKSWKLWPSLTIDVNNIHKAKHGSDSQSYDRAGRFNSERLTELFDKYDTNGDGFLSLWDILRMTEGNRDAFDWFGWAANKIEWGFLWLLCRNDRGLVSKECIIAQGDGTLFYRIEQERRESNPSFTMQFAQRCETRQKISSKKKQWAAVHSGVRSRRQPMSFRDAVLQGPHQSIQTQ